MKSIDKLLNVAKNEIGYLEKRSNIQLDSKTANAGSSNYTKYARDLYPSLQGQPWCDMFVDWCFVQAFGRVAAQQLLGGGFSAYTPTSAQYYKIKGQYHKDSPQPGDQIFFKNSQRICHTGIVYEVTMTKVRTIEGNTSDGSEVVANGGAVCCKEYSLDNSRIDGYGRPDWSLVERPEYEVGWHHDNNGWWYRRPDGTYPANKWCVINHHWYLFNKDGYACTSWHRWNGTVCDPEDGSGDWYYFDPTPNGLLEGACWHSQYNGAQQIWYIEDSNSI